MSPYPDEGGCVWEQHLPRWTRREGINAACRSMTAPWAIERAERALGVYEFHGAGGSGRRPWLCQHAPSIGTDADSPQAEERAKAADAHRMARVLCDEYLFFVFLTEAMKKTRFVRL